MKRLSSKLTFFYKRVIPLFFFGILAFGVCNVVLRSLAKGQVEPLMFFLVGILGVAAIGFFLMKRDISDLVDEVWDNGDTLIVRNKRREERIAISDCINVSYSGMVTPPRITLTLRSPSGFGSEISFTPPFRLVPFSMPAIARDLIVRIDATRKMAHN